MVEPISDGDHGENNQCRDLDNVDGKIYAGRRVHPSIRDVSNEERKNEQNRIINSGLGTAELKTEGKS